MIIIEIDDENTDDITRVNHVGDFRNNNRNAPNMNNVFSVQNSKKPKQKKGLCIAHLNIATLPGHYDEFKFLMHGNSYDIMGLSETRLDYYNSR